MTSYQKGEMENLSRPRLKKPQRCCKEKGEVDKIKMITFYEAFKLSKVGGKDVIIR